MKESKSECVIWVGGMGSYEWNYNEWERYIECVRKEERGGVERLVPMSEAKWERER